MSKTIAAVIAGLALSLGAAPALAKCVVQAIADLPVTMAELKPLVPAKIDGKELMFVADSGAFYSMLSPTTAKDLKLSHDALPPGYRVSGVGGDGNAYLTVVNTFTIARVPIPRVEFLVVSGSGAAAGLLGQNLWGLGDVEYDLAGGTIRLFKPKDCGNEPLAYWASASGFSMLNIRTPEEANPHTVGEAYINGKRISVIFDTGAGTSVLTRGAAERIGIKTDAPGVTLAGMTSGIGSRPVKVWIAPIASFKIADEEIRNTKLQIGDFDLGADMLLGADFFLSHRVYVANGQGKLYFTYNGGPVFNIGGSVLVQDGENGAAKPPTIDAGAEPKDADGYARRGAAFAARKDWDRAIADLTRACDLAPTEPKYFFQRAQARLQNRQPALAMADLDQTLKFDPKNLQALMVRGQVRLGERDKTGTADYDAVADLAAKNADLRLGLAGLYARAEMFDAAIDQVGLWIDAHPDDGRLAQAYNDRCWARAVSGKDLDKALGDCNRALDRAPKTAAFLDSRGLVRLRQGDNDRAIADFDAALALQPKLAWSLYGRGLAKLRKGLTVESKTDIAAAVALQPKIGDQARQYGVLTAGEG